MSPLDVLGPALAEAVRKLVREELQARGATAPATPAPPELLSPEEAARRFKGRPSADTIRGLIHRGRIPPRLAGETPNPKRPSYLVRVDEILAALETSGKPLPASEQAADLEAARARARERAGKQRGGR
jgi:hypothetical protein